MAANRTLNGLQHHVANHAAADAGVGDRMPSNDPAVVSIDNEGQAYQSPFQQEISRTQPDGRATNDPEGALR